MSRAFSAVSPAVPAVPATRKEAARAAAGAPPGPQRQEAIEAYLQGYDYELAAIRTLVFEGIILAEMPNVPSLANDLFASIPPQDVAAMCSESLQGPGGNEAARLQDASRRRVAHGLYEEALEQQLIDAWQAALSSGDPIEQARFAYTHANYDQAVQALSETSGWGSFVLSGVRQYFAGVVNKDTENSVLLFSQALRLPETPGELTARLSYRKTSNEQVQGRPYVDLRPKPVLEHA